MGSLCLRLICAAYLLSDALCAVELQFLLLKCRRHQFEKECGTRCANDEQKCECSEEQWQNVQRNCARKFEENRSNCAPHEVRKSARCHERKKPGELCNFTEQSPLNAHPGTFQWERNASHSQSLDSGGDCVHPRQCLSGSVCIKGRCRGPCDENQVFIDDGCVDYEGAGCVARACVKHKCPRAFPSCNYVPQKGEYLCCERQIRSTAQCPDPVSIPQLSELTNEVVNCMAEQCEPGFTCQFSNNERGSYICCSVPGQRTGEKKTEIIINKNLWH
uniref:EB domain-containing protein n=1 Tax=Globodera rostochiensis TaxID=31243 RepID=A0A914I463_GLORO